MWIVGIGVKGVDSRIALKLGSLDPLLGHVHRLAGIHLPVEAQHRPVIPPVSPALFGVLAHVVRNAPTLIFAGNAKMLLVGDVPGFPNSASTVPGDVHRVGPSGSRRLADRDLAKRTHDFSDGELGTVPGTLPISFSSLTRHRRRETNTSPSSELPALR